MFLRDEYFALQSYKVIFISQIKDILIGNSPCSWLFPLRNHTLKLTPFYKDHESKEISLSIVNFNENEFISHYPNDEPYLL